MINCCSIALVEGLFLFGLGVILIMQREAYRNKDRGWRKK